MQQKLELSLSLVVDWLKFAEGKNATLIAANGAAIYWLINLYASSSFSNELLNAYVLQALLFLFMSAMFCLTSFIPQVKVGWSASGKDPQEKDNLLAYADIAGYEPAHYLEALYKQNGVEQENVDPFEEDLAELVVTYSRIAMRKYALFNLGVWCVLSAIVTPVIALGIYFVRRRHVIS